LQLTQVDHLLRKKRARETPNWAQGYFETSLRGYSGQDEKAKMSFREKEKQFKCLPFKPKTDGSPA